MIDGSDGERQRMLQSLHFCLYSRLGRVLVCVCMRVYVTYKCVSWFAAQCVIEVGVCVCVCDFACLVLLPDSAWSCQMEMGGVG